MTKEKARTILLEPTLSAHDASIILLTHQTHSFTDTNIQFLLQVVSSSHAQWIVNDPLFEVILRTLALYSATPEYINGDYMGLLARRLIRSEMAPAGPYFGDKTYSDLATNAIISQLFHTFNTPLDHVDTFIKRHLDEQKTLVAYRGEWALTWPQSLTKTTPTVDYTHFSKEMARLLTANSSIARPKHSNERKQSTETILASIRQDFTHLTGDIHPTANNALASLADADKIGEISLLSEYFVDSLAKPITIPRHFVNHLGTANYYTWMAYTIYDDLLDNEGTTQNLPFANIMHRRALDCFLFAANGNATSNELITSTFDAMDSANSWEINHSRYDISGSTITVEKLPRYSNGAVLAERAGAHVLGPLIITQQYTRGLARQKQHIHKGLEHYLIARQLNDDLHDWKEDLYSGHISFVVTHLFRQLRIRPGTYSLDSLAAQMQTYFWQQGLEEMCTLIIKHIDRAAADFQDSKVLLPDSPFVQLTIAPIKQSATRSIDTHKNHIQFLDTFTHQD